MTWRKFFKPVNSVLPANQRHIDSTGSMSTSKYSNWLPEFYSGPTGRLQRYSMYEQMGLDHEISAALDTIADFGTEPDLVTKQPLVIQYNNNDPTPAEIQIIEKTLGQWLRLNKLNRRLWGMFRNTLTYGDQFFIRDPETFKLYWVDPAKVEKVIVNESDGKKIESYYIKDIDLNVKSLVATNQLNKVSNAAFGGNAAVFSPPMQGNMNFITSGYSGGGTANYQDNAATHVDAAHIVQLTLTDGMNSAWPFGLSILEQIFKVYKQKELLEDSILIYRVHRAPERRVFFIDVGTMPPNKAQQYLERVKYEVQQKRIPSRSSNGSNISDSVTNPMSMLEDYYLSVTSDGRGSRIEVLPGGENLGCFSLDTKIKLLDDRDLSISDIESEMKAGRKLWTYSCHPITGDIAPGLISWAGKTKSDAEVMEITLDNDEKIICTPDHKFVILGQGFVEAKDLYEGQSLTPIYTEKKQISETKKLDYEMVYNPCTKEWVYTHRLVMNFLKEKGIENTFTYNNDFLNSIKDVRHHVDHNRYNNSPDNLVWMNWTDHKLYHQEYGFSEESQKLGTEAARIKMAELKENDKAEYDRIILSQISGRAKWRDSLSEHEKSLINESISVSLKEYIQELSKDEKSKRDDICINNLVGANDRFMWLLDNDAEFLSFFKSQISNGQSKSKIDNPDIWKNRSKSISEANIKRWKLDGYYDKVFDSQLIKYDARLIEMFTNIYLENKTRTKKEFSVVLTNNLDFIAYFKRINIEVHTNTNLDSFEEKKISDMLLCVNMTWESFKILHTSIIVSDKLKVMKSKFVDGMSQVEYISILRKELPELGSRHLMISELNKCGIEDFKTFKEYALHVNHRIKSIKYLDEKMDVGTLTIDIDEKYHDYHTYALSAGVFVKNSIDDLRYFNNKMMRALGVPSSYLPTGPEDGTASVTDGRIGSAFIQEFRFSKIVSRYQQQMVETLDMEFKLFLKFRGITIDNSIFELQFTEPQSFSEYRKLELQSAQINSFQALLDVPFISKRYLLKEYLNWSDAQLAENERMWKEEKSRLTKTFAPNQSLGGGGSAPAGLSDVGISSSGIDDMSPEGGMPDEDGAGLNDAGNDSGATDQEIGGFGNQ